jgi:hypothetical protein
MATRVPHSFSPFGDFDDADVAVNEAGELSVNQLQRIDLALPKVIRVAGILFTILLFAAWYTRDTACWRFVGCQQVDDGRPTLAFLFRAVIAAAPCALLVWVARHEATKRKAAPVQHLRGTVQLDTSALDHPKRFVVPVGGGRTLLGYGTSGPDGTYAPGDVYDIYFVDAAPPQGALLLSSRRVQD